MVKRKMRRRRRTTTNASLILMILVKATVKDVLTFIMLKQMRG